MFWGCLWDALETNRKDSDWTISCRARHKTNHEAKSIMNSALFIVCKPKFVMGHELLKEFTEVRGTLWIEQKAVLYKNSWAAGIASLPYKCFEELSLYIPFNQTAQERETAEQQEESPHHSVFLQSFLCSPTVVFQAFWNPHLKKLWPFQGVLRATNDEPVQFTKWASQFISFHGSAINWHKLHFSSLCPSLLPYCFRAL